jgi:hypothetical protein
MSELRQFNFANFARSTLLETISADTTTVRVQEGLGAVFPTADTTYGEIFAIIVGSGSTFEIMYVTAKANDTFTVERGKEGTTAREWAAGTVIVHSVTAAFFEQQVGIGLFALTATLTDIQEITLTWGDLVGADHYEIWRNEDGGAYSQIDADATSPFVDDELERGIAYRYYVLAVPTAGDNVQSSIELVNVPAATPPVLSAEITSSGEATLTWTDAVNMVVDHYEVWRSVGGAAFAQLEADATSPVVDTGLAPESVYDYYILAVDALSTADDEQSNEVGVDGAFFETFMLIHVEGGEIYEVTGFPTVTLVGDGAVSDVQAKFGDESFLNPGTTAEGTDFVRVEGDATDFVFPGEFTWEGWFYINELTASYDNIFANNLNFPAAGFIQLAVAPAGRMMFNSSAGGLTANVGDLVPTGQWIHFAVSRDASNVVRMFMDGVLQQSGTISGTVGGDNAGVSSFDVCRGHASDNSDLDCYFEEIRVSKVCRYSAAFTPPTDPFEPYPGI